MKHELTSYAFTVSDIELIQRALTVLRDTTNFSNTRDEAIELKEYISRLQAENIKEVGEGQH